MTNESEEPPSSSSIGRTVEYAFENYKAEDWEKLFQAFTEMMIKTKKASTAEKKTLSWPVFAIITLIFAGVLALVAIDKIEGQIVTSIGSVIVGYLLSFLGGSFGSGTE